MPARLGKRTLALAAATATALLLPYATPALCAALSDSAPQGHDVCQEPAAGASLVAGATAPTCALGDCATAPTAPPGGELTTLAILAVVDALEPELSSLLLTEAAAPPTHPPQA